MESKLRELADERGWSLNQAANFLLEKGAGLHAECKANDVKDQLGEFFGSWTKEEADALEQRIAEATGMIDEELWK